MRSALQRGGIIGAALTCAATAVATAQAATAENPPFADMMAYIVESASTVAPGQTVEYQVHVRNDVPDGIVGLNAEKAGVFISRNGGRLLSIKAPATGKCKANKRSIKGFMCRLGTIAPDTEMIVVVTLQAPNKPGTMGLNADSFSNLVDPDMYNNSWTEMTTVAKTAGSLRGHTAR